MYKDYYWLNQNSREFLSRGYIAEGVEPEKRYREIAEAAERILGIDGFADRFEANLKRGWYSLASPIISNFGIERGLPISCNGSYVDDNLESIMYKAAEIGIMSKHGAGTSAYLGALRHRGASIGNDGGTSTGPVHFAEIFDTITNVVSQSNVRRGSCAVYMDTDHPDIEEFLTIRDEKSNIQDLTFGVCIPDSFYEKLKKKDPKSLRIWGNIIKKRFKSGFPYIFNTDNVNNNKPDCYKDDTIYASNLCVTGDQMVVTSEGIKSVYDLYNENKDLILFDGNKTVTASPMRLIEKDAKVFEIKTKEGRSHKVTDYHKVKTDKGMVAAKDLKHGDRVYIQRNKGLFGDVHKPEMAFLLGMYQADGTQTENSIFIDVWEHDFDLCEKIESYIDHVYKEESWEFYEGSNQYGTTFSRSTKIPKFHNCTTSASTVKKKRLGSVKLKQFGFCKNEIPNWLWQADEVTQWAYISGLFYADGSVFVSESPGNPIQLYLSNIDKKFLQKVQILLDNLGVKFSIYLAKPEGRYSLPDGKGGMSLYDCKTTWKLACGNKPDCLVFEDNTKFLSRKNVHLDSRVYRNNSKKLDTVEEVVYSGRQDVYCTTVNTEEHLWVCNSFITSNCTEIMLPSNPIESFVCDLSSMNLVHYEEWRHTDAVELLVYFLDAVMTEYIEKTDGIKFMEHARNFAIRHRALGVGGLGWHSYLQSKMIPFESMEAKYKNVEIWKFIKEKAYKASKELAVMFGEPEKLKGFGRRNTTLLAIAPTVSSSFILGQVSPGIEPEKSNYYKKDLAKGGWSRKNPYLKTVLEFYGKNTKETWNSIEDTYGSVQHLDFLSPVEKDVFKTFAEISQKEVVIQAAQRQKYIDQAQSLNLEIHPDTNPKDVSDLLIFGWEQGIKTFYYQKGENAAKMLVRDINKCLGCDG